MNIIDIIICVILGLSLVAGMYKGFLSSSLSLLAFGGSWYGAYRLYERLTNLVRDNGAIMDSLRSVFDAGEMFSTSGLAAVRIGDASADQLAQAASEIHIPLISDMFRNNMTGKVFEALNLSTISEYLTETLIVAVLNVAAFLIAFIVVYFVATLIVNLLNSVFRFPQLRHLDWLLGGVLGAVRGVVILLLIFAVLPTATKTLESLHVKALQDVIDESKLAVYFTDTTLLTNFMNAVMK